MALADKLKQKKDSQLRNPENQVFFIRKMSKQLEGIEVMLDVIGRELKRLGGSNEKMESMDVDVSRFGSQAGRDSSSDNKTNKNN